MGEEMIRNVLKTFGLTEKEVDVYLFLSKYGALKGGEIAKTLKTHKAQIYRILKSLQAKGIVESTLEAPVRFVAVPFESVIDMNIKAKRDEAESIEKTKEELLNFWKAIGRRRLEPSIEKFGVIEGRHKIYPKISQMISETTTELSVVSTVPDLLRADQFGLFDALLHYPRKSGVRFRFLTEMSSNNFASVKNLFERIPKTELRVEGRNPAEGVRMFPRMVIRDTEEVIFFISPKNGTDVSGQDNMCLWTNCKDLVQTFGGIFEGLWQNSTDIQVRIKELETGISLPFTSNVGDRKDSRPNYVEILHSATKDIIIATSAKGIASCWKSIEPLRDWGGGVSIRIMAPITSENIHVVKQLSSFCEIRHIPKSAVSTTIVDGKHLFQFVNPLQNREEAETEPSVENTYYTNNHEYLERMRGMLCHLWENASLPSTVTLKAILSPVASSGGYPDLEKAATERLKKSDEAKLFSKDGWFGHGIIGKAIIHPPSHLGIPDMMIHVKKIAEDAAFGGHDLVVFFLSSSAPTGQRFVPVAVINTGARSLVMEKVTYAGTPAARNLILVKPEQLEVIKQDNMLFAGWTVPVELIPSKYTLQPSCIMFEAVGEPTHYQGATSTPSGEKVSGSGDAYEAFVTFINPSLNYMGPGTDGFIGEAGGNVVTGRGRLKSSSPSESPGLSELFP